MQTFRNVVKNTKPTLYSRQCFQLRTEIVLNANDKKKSKLKVIQSVQKLKKLKICC